MSRSVALAALKQARKRGGRLGQVKVYPNISRLANVVQQQDTNIYDEVSDEQYRSIVGTRNDQDDFIVDDDGSGYVDNGEEDWDHEDDEESEDEDDFDGEDEELRKARKLKRAKLKAKAAKAKADAKTKAKPKSSFSDYARPASASTSTYRPAPSAINEDDFMASLMSSVTSAPTRKRKSSPEIPSSEGNDVELSSEGSFFGSNRKRFGEEEEEVWDAKRGVMGKKPRRSELTIKPDYSDIEMDTDEAPVFIKSERKDDEEVDDDDEEELEIKRPLVSASTKINGAVQPRRKVVNSSSIKYVKPEPIIVKAEVDSVPLSKPPTYKAKPASDKTNWQSVQESLLPPKVSDLDTVKPHQGTIKTENILEEDGSLRMFWLDFMEADGVVHLVGKVQDRSSKRWVSCCLSIMGIERNLFVKPRTKRFSGSRETDLDVSRTDVYEDFDSVRRKAGVEQWRAKFVQRKYAFEDKTVDKGESEWLKVVYGFDEPEIPKGTSGPTFSHIFGTHTTPFELLVIKRKIMGPCWLDVKNATISTKSTSWCKIEFSVSDPKHVNPFAETDQAAPRDTPPLTIMSLSARTIVNHRENKTEILCATARTWEGCNIDDPTPPDKMPSSVFTIVRPIEKFPPGFEARAKSDRSPFQTVKAERALLNSLLATIQRLDPDIIVGHDFSGNILEALLLRMKELKADHPSRFGRFRRKRLNIVKAGNNWKFLAGRLVADLTSDMIKNAITLTTWSLTEMCSSVLNIEREDIDQEDTHSYFDHTLSGPDKLLKFVRMCEVDSFFQMAIAARLQLIPLAKQSTNLSGSSWSLTLNTGRSTGNEYILLHEFHRLKYVVPDKPTWSGEASSNKAKYLGGKVFEPKKGLYDKYILIMDFNSLYPSIIQEYNIDFTTVERDEIDNEEVDGAIPEIPEHDVAQGVLPRIIATLVGRRRQVKGLMKDKSASAAKLQQYDIKQKALKLTANSMYGCLGLDGSRFSSRPLAALTTFKGREILTHTSELAESMQLEVVYGDTDSVFVNSNVDTYAEALKIANEFKKMVNERYKLLEIDLDATFSRLLLLQKKKYAAIKIDEQGNKTTEIKGLDMKRREFSKVSKDISGAVLREVLSGEATETVAEKICELLSSLGQRVRGGEVPLEDFIIFKRLGKNPEDYAGTKDAHVHVALRMKAKGVSARTHDVIPYIICLGPDGKSSKSAQGEKAFHPDDLRRQGSELKIDYGYYLNTQVLTPVFRLCGDIEGLDQPRLAECLGLDPANYQAQGEERTEKEFFTFESQIPDKERFKDADPLPIRCMACETSFDFEGILNDSANMIQPTGIICPACSSNIHTASMAVQLENQIRKHIALYYQGWTICDGEGCHARTRMMGVYGKRCLGMEREGCKGTVRLEYSDLKLYNQLLFYLSLFDAEKALSTVNGSGRFEEIKALTTANQAAFTQLAAVADKYLDRNGRRYVDMKGLFGFMERIKL
ncbi:DNA polymerase alpha subunit A, partial [Tremellales sp. Uapishka_1]